MVLRYLKLTNFLSHENTEVELPESGIFLLAGDSGAGKSSFIIDATAYSLFGPAAVTRAKKHSEIVTSEKQGMSVRAVFEFSANDSIVIDRGLSPNGMAFAKLYSIEDNDQLVILAEGAKEVGRSIAKRLGGMNWRQFYAAFVAKQDEISKLTNLRGNERKLLVHRMLGMKELEKAAEINSQKLKRARAEVDQLQLTVGGFDPEQAAENIRELNKRLRKQKTEKDLFEANIKADEETFKKIEKSAPNLEQIYQALIILPKLEAELENIEINYNKAEQALEKSVKAKKAAIEYKPLAEELRDVKKEITDLREIYSRSQKIVKLTKQLAEFAKPKIDETSQELSNRIASVETEIKQIKEIIKEREAEVNKLIDTGECYVCQRPFADKHDHKHVIDDLFEKIGEMKKSIQSKTDTTALLKEKVITVKKNEKVLSERNQLEIMIKEIKTEENGAIDELAKQGKQMAAKEKELSTALARLEIAKEDYDEEAPKKVQDAKDTFEEKTKLIKEKKTLTKGYDLETITSTKETITELINKIDKNKTGLQSVEEALSITEKDVIKSNKEVASRVDDLARLEKLREKSMDIENSGNCIKGFQKQLAMEIRPSLEQIGSEMLASISAGKHVAMNIDENYEITIEDSEGALKRASLLSGGEQIRANICLRLALTRLVSSRTGVPVGFLIFDEPLPSQDKGHIERIMSLLLSLKGFYQQQFLISHVGDLRSADEINYIIDFTDEVILSHA